MFAKVAASFRWMGTVLSTVRKILANLIFLAVLVFVVSAILSAPKPKLAHKSALMITFANNLVEQESYHPDLQELIGADTRQAETVLRDVISAIHYAATDKQITGLILNLNYLNYAGMSKTEEIGQAIEEFKKSGKPVIAFADNMMQQQYLLASYADEIYLHNFGGLYFTGFGLYRDYYKDAIDKIALKFHVFKAGKYKDAVEPFIANKMSPASREHTSAWVNQLWRRYMSIVETQRELPRGALDNYIANFAKAMDEHTGDAAALALENHLVDATLSKLELKDRLMDKFGADADDNLNAVSMEDYLASPLLEKSKSKNKIGLIVASGTIYDGEQADGNIGSQTLSNLIAQARDDGHLKALVLRIDSGGGSAFGSEVIREQIIKTKQAGLPVYVSMGSMAASGGYWISSSADEIWATPSTLTGSIGVWSLIPNFSGSLEKLGIHSDGVGTTPYADAFSPERPMSPDVQKVFQASVDNVYDRFVKLVAAARKSTPADIDKIAQGHVWTGEDALDLGLVDHLGTLDDALHEIAKINKLQDYSVELIERKLSPREEVMRFLVGESESLRSQIKAELLQSTLPESSQLAKDIKNLSALPKHGSILSQCFECGEF